MIGPREYDREFTSPVRSAARRRIGYDHEQGRVTRFVIQLEYTFDGAWYPIVRFDHDPLGHHGHDVSEEGVHMDVFREGAKLRTEEIFPPMRADRALTFAEAHLNTHAERYIKRFERWHEIQDR